MEEALRVEEERRVNEERKAEEERQRQIRLENERKEEELRRIELERQTAEQKAALDKLKQEEAEKARIQKENELAEKATLQLKIDEKNQHSKCILKKLRLTTLIIFAITFVANLIASIASSANIGSDIATCVLMLLIFAGIPTLLSRSAIKTTYGANGAKKLLKFLGSLFSIVGSVAFLILGIAMLATAAFSFGITFVGIAAICISNIVFLKKTKKIV